MFLKVIVLAFLATVVLAQEIPEAQGQHIRDILRTQCAKNNAEDKVDEVENAGKNFMECVKSLINVQTLQKEIEEAKPNGALDEVFKKYCAKTPEFKTCIHTLLDGVTPCLDTNARDQISTVKNGTNQLIDFICFKDGDRIALFIAEHGPECFQSKMNELKQCGENLKNSISSLDAAKSLTTDERCAKFDEMTTCLVNKLEGCETPTPANMAESLFRYMRQGTTCKKTSN